MVGLLLKGVQSEIDGEDRWYREGLSFSEVGTEAGLCNVPMAIQNFIFFL